mmetsp:Transcript_6893/g.20974  ORF Transcript_6893/g.20974 Transcript_6893/m.20974 type:complete len:401 (-) Transcript_6893:214-1416(-)
MAFVGCCASMRAGRRTQAVLAPSPGSAAKSSSTAQRRTKVNVGEIKKMSSRPLKTRRKIVEERIEEEEPKLMRTRKDKVPTDSTLLLYLKEIGSVTMLEGDEVVECSKSVQKLLKWETVMKEKTAELGREPTELEWANALGVPQARFGRELARMRKSKERLIAGNLRLVVSIAKKYVSNSKLNMLDLIQEGSLGLIRGAERFDASKGFRFATYASWWIRQAVQRAADESSRQIRLPSHLNTTARKVYRLRKQMFVKNLKEPTYEELAQELDMTVARLRFIMEKEKETDTLSLDNPIRSGDGDNVFLSDFIMDERLSPEQTVTQSLLRDDLENVLSMLTDTEKQVMRMRYGFDDGMMKNYEQIASMYSVPSVKIRQIEARALRKLRHPNLNRCLKEYVQFQ